ncbi:hypothetical protein TL16_g09191 [Triparma laevis f. inornata]|uniref:Uncharacterized protein n=1 Tax=Triparma laevis f. inornata TaxID=1714386 RepID=A0A9W7B8G1_9STRA|nr:hypothetical protein TL16_g09191 [Triparma laevis f. inornata]
MFSHIGPDVYYTTPYSSSASSAPLKYLKPSPESCPTCCSDFASTSGSSQLTALVVSKTVFLEMNDLLVYCQINTFIGLETLYLSLVNSGAKAIIHGALYGTPGLVSNLVSTSVEKQILKNVLSSPIPLIGVGESASTFLLGLDYQGTTHHVEFLYDDNEYQEFYKSWCAVPFKLAVYIIVFACMNRCMSHGLSFTSKTSYLPALTTKNLVVVLGAIQVFSLVMNTATNGLAYFDANSSGWSFLSVGRLCPVMGMCSSWLVARLWKSRTGHTFVDPCLNHPKASFVIPVGAFFIDVITMIVTLQHKNNLRPMVALIYMIVMFGYIYLAVFFAYSGLKVLRSLSESDKPLKTMALYLLATAVTTLASLIAFVQLATGKWATSTTSVFVMTGLYYFGNMGMTMCNLFIFADNVSVCEVYGSSEIVPMPVDGTFLETENKRLAEKDVENKKKIEDLKIEQARAKENSELTAKLLATEKTGREEKGLLAARLEREKIFIASALHEIRNPLNCIMLGIEYIFTALFKELTPGLMEEFRSIEKCASHQQLVLESILSLDKLLNGSQKLHIQDFKPAKVCSEVLVMTQRSVKTGVVIKFEELNVLDEYVMGAPTQLKLMLLNLVTNASKFTVEGTINIILEKVSETEIDATYRFSVSDTGPGVPKALQAYIFGMRQQSHDESGDAKGFGVGLSVASKLTSLMGGELNLESPLSGGDGGGSEFSFILSFKKSNRAPGSLVESTESSSGNSSDIPNPPTGLFVLIADDSEMNRKLLKRTLTTGPFKKLSWTVDLAASGEETLEMCGEEEGKKYDVIIIDEFMVEGGGTLLGTEVTKQLRQRKKYQAAVIVGCTGNCADEDLAKSLESGQDVFWGKPVPPADKALDDISRAWMGKNQKKNREGGSARWVNSKG